MLASYLTLLNFHKIEMPGLGKLLALEAPFCAIAQIWPQGIASKQWNAKRPNQGSTALNSKIACCPAIFRRQRLAYCFYVEQNGDKKNL